MTTPREDAIAPLEPTTQAGKAMLTGRPWLGRDHESILVIEREAVAAFLASPETAEALALAMLPLIRPVLEDIGVEETEVEWCRGFAASLLAAWRETGR